MDGMAEGAVDGTCRSRNYVRADAEKEKRLIRAAERGDAFNDSRSSSSVVVHHNLVNEPLMADAEAQPRWGGGRCRKKKGFGRGAKRGQTFDGKSEQFLRRRRQQPAPPTARCSASDSYVAGFRGRLRCRTGKEEEAETKRMRKAK